MHVCRQSEGPAEAGQWPPALLRPGPGRVRRRRNVCPAPWGASGGERVDGEDRKSVWREKERVGEERPGKDWGELLFLSQGRSYRGNGGLSDTWRLDSWQGHLGLKEKVVWI